MANNSLEALVEVDYEGHRGRQEETKNRLAALAKEYQQISSEMSVEAVTERNFLSFLQSAISPVSGLGVKERARNAFLAAQRVAYSMPIVGKYLVVRRPVSSLLEESLDRVKEWHSTLGNYQTTLEQLSEELAVGLTELNGKAVTASKGISSLKQRVQGKQAEVESVETQYKATEDKTSPDALQLRADIDKRKEELIKLVYDSRNYGDSLRRIMNLTETDRLMIEAIGILHPEIYSLHQQIGDWVDESERSIKTQAQITRAGELIMGTAASTDRLKKRYNQILVHTTNVIGELAGRVTDLVSGELTNPENLAYARERLAEARERQLAIRGETTLQLPP